MIKELGLHCLKAADCDELDVYRKQRQVSVELSQEGKREFILGIAKTVGVSKEVKMSTGYPHWTQMCCKCWSAYHGVRTAQMAHIGGLVKTGHLSASRKRKGSVPARRRAAGSNCFYWLQNYARTHGDHMPDSLEVHLPDYRWRDVWKKYKAEVLSHSKNYSDAVGESAFNQIHTTELPYIKIRKVKRFAACKTCAQLREQIDKASGERKALLKVELDSHIEWQYREREKYYKHRFKARTWPHKYMTMSVDGMDNGKTAIPRLARENKGTDDAIRLGTHLTGVLMHGRKNPVYAYTWFERFPTGSDSIVTIVCNALQETLKEGPLPPVLYLHMDNCSRENKNRYILALNHLLILANIFIKVKLSFLPVGHTHDDVDQFFSKINAVLTTRDILCLEDLHEAVQTSFLPRPVCIHLDDMGMFVPWLTKYLEKNIIGHSEPRCYLFKRCEQNDVVGHFYRQQMQTSKKVDPDSWFPTNQPTGLCVFKTNPLEEDPFVYRVPYKVVDVEGLRRTVGCMRGAMSTAQCSWWDELLNSFKGNVGACVTCDEIRVKQQESSANKTDSDEVRKKKQRDVRKAGIELQKHMYEANHQMFHDWLPHARPAHEEPIRNQEGSNDAALQAIQASSSLRLEGIVNHHVGKAAKRDVWERLPVWTVEVGHLAVFRTDDKDEPWILGEILEVSDEANALNQHGMLGTEAIKIHEMGRAGKDKNAPVKIGMCLASRPVGTWTPTGKYHYRYQTLDKGVVKDVYEVKNKPKSNRTIVSSVHSRDCIVWWGPRDKVLKADTTLLKLVLVELDKNPNVMWKMPVKERKLKPKQNLKRKRSVDQGSREEAAL